LSAIIAAANQAANLVSALTRVPHSGAPGTPTLGVLGWRFSLLLGGRISLTNKKIAITLNKYAIIDGIAPPIPVRHIHRETMNGVIRRCGTGSQTVPSCRGPGVCESKTRRAMLI